MTDNEIIKALKGLTEGCFDCNDGCKQSNKCPVNIISCALDLINRQKEEIERLKDLITYQKQEIKEKEQKYNQAVDDMFGLIETTKNEVKETTEVQE